MFLINDFFRRNRKKIPGLHISRETIDKFNLYQSQIQKWNKAFSLVQKKTLSEFYLRHILDSLQLVPCIADCNTTIVDIGTGAGFPGMVLAMCGYSKITLVESNTKKIIFLKEIARLTSTSVTILEVRAESITKKFDFVVSRACSSLTNLLSLMNHVSRETTKGVFHKGETYDKEIEEASKNWKFSYDLYPSVTEPKSKIIKVQNLELK